MGEKKKKRSEKKEREREREKEKEISLFFREVARARAPTFTLWLSSEGDQEVTSRSVRKGVREHPAIYERPAKLISRRQKLLLQEVVVLSLSLSLSPSFLFYLSHYSFWYRGFLVLLVAMWLASGVPYSTDLQRYGESLVRSWCSIGNCGLHRNKSHILQFFTILSERNNLILYLTLYITFYYH